MNPSALLPDVANVARAARAHLPALRPGVARSKRRMQKRNQSSKRRNRRARSAATTSGCCALLEVRARSRRAPAEKLNPRRMPSMSINAIDSPVATGMQRVQHRRKEHEGELDGLRHAGQERCERQRREQPRYLGTTLRRSGAIHRKARARQTEHHHREESGHERARRRVACEESLQIASRTVIVAENEPCEVIEDVMQPR